MMLPFDAQVVTAAQMIRATTVLKPKAGRPSVLKDRISSKPGNAACIEIGNAHNDVKTAPSIVDTIMASGAFFGHSMKDKALNFGHL